MSGRIRTIKPELLEDAVTAGLSETAFRLFIGMIVIADDHGVLRAEPGSLMGQVFWKVPPSKPLDEAIEEVGRKLVQLYEIDGQRYAFIRNWEKHQKVSHKGKRRLPAPPETLQNSSGDSPESFRPDLRPATSDQRPASGAREAATESPAESSPAPDPRLRGASAPVSATVPIAAPRTDLGGLEPEAYAEGLALATGGSCAAPRGAGNVQALRDALRVHGPEGADAEARRVWLRDTARDYAVARKGGQLSPRWFVEWLDSGRPAQRAPPGPQRLVQPVPATGRLWKIGDAS